MLLPMYLRQGTVPFRLHEVSNDELYMQKPQWLLDLHPPGTVPFLAWQQTDSSTTSNHIASPYPATSAANSKQKGAVVVAESLVINEYLEDAYRELHDSTTSSQIHHLLPKDPVGRAAARLLIRRIDDQFVPAFKQLIENFRQTAAEQQAAAEKLDREITQLLQHYDPQGPFALSDRLSLVDCAVAPHVLRLYILKHYAEYRYKGPQTDRLRRYMRALHKHPAVVDSCYHPEGLGFQEELLKKYAHYGVTMAYKHLKPLW
eukprot:GHUV01020854.1.p1 GENE.GHUV01020854.1~~GHUV01020854.1.p1  ORF type:complete len:260 (+),score=56.41 GHUV01020854.1:628-1407(+)